MSLRRALLLFTLGLMLACGDGNGPATSAFVIVAPVLDSLFVGDIVLARAVTYYDAHGDIKPTGPVTWSSSDPAVARVDAATGEIVAAGRGAALLVAHANGIDGTALLVVSRTLELSLLLDTLYLMPGDTMTVPVAVRRKGGSPPTVSFQPTANGVFTIDATGLITANGGGGPLPFIAHADTVSATGAVEVVQLSDTLGGKGFVTVLGTVIRRDRTGARGLNYLRHGDTATFRISLPLLQGSVVVENMLITLRDSVHTPALFPVDSVSPDELFGTGSDPICRPPRPWGLWSLQLNPPLRALSRRGGSLSITQVVPVAHGRAISGRFEIIGQRYDLYDDPLAALPIRGTFVAPLIDDPTHPCR